MLLPGYIPATCLKNNIVILLVTPMLYYRNITCLLGTNHSENQYCHLMILIVLEKNSKKKKNRKLSMQKVNGKFSK